MGSSAEEVSYFSDCAPFLGIIARLTKFNAKRRFKKVQLATLATMFFIKRDATIRDMDDDGGGAAESAN